MTKKINKTIDLNKILQRQNHAMVTRFQRFVYVLIFTRLFHKRTDEKHNTYWWPIIDFDDRTRGDL